MKRIKIKREECKKWINYGIIGGIVIGVWGGIEAIKKASDKSIEGVTSLCEVENIRGEGRWIRIAGNVIETESYPLIGDSSGCLIRINSHDLLLAEGKKEMTAYVKNGEVVEVDNIFDNPDITDMEGNLEEVISTTIVFNGKTDIPWGSKNMKLTLRVPMEDKVGYCPNGYGNYNHRTYKMDCLETLTFPVEIYRSLRKGREYKINYTEGSRVVRSVEEQ